MTNFEKLKHDLTPAQVMSMLGVRCWGCPAHHACEADTAEADCEDFFLKWADAEADEE